MEVWSGVLSTKVGDTIGDTCINFFPNKATACIYLAIVIIVGFGMKDKSCSKVFIMMTISGSSVMWTGRVVVIPAE